LRLISCALLAVAGLPVFAADVYRSVEPDGTVVYSDRPGEGTERVTIATLGGSSSTPRTAPPTGGTPARNAAPQAEQLGTEVRVEPTPEETAAERARNCAVAQERAERYRVSQRLYRTLPNGEREYLSDAELDEARARADADVANWCG
jgi:hypothetical protein